MRVLFVYPDLAGDVTNYTGVTSYGVSILSALLKEDGHDVELFHVTRESSEDAFKAQVRAAEPDLVGFSTNSHYARRLEEWTRWAAEASGAPVIVGGVHATLAPDEVSALPHVDYVCVGEGERAVAELCRALAADGDPTAIPNVWARVEGGVVRNPQRPLLADLDQLPDPDYSVFDFANLYPVRRGMLPVIMSRGCAFRCTYCSVHALRDLAPGGERFWRFLSPRRAVRQIRALLDRYQPDAETVLFLDTIFFPNRAWLRKFAPLYKETVGLPEETLRMALATIRLNAEIDPELVLSFIFYPYPGTRLHDLCEERGYLTDREYDHYAVGVATRLPSFREGDILFLHRFFRPLVRLYGRGRGRRVWLDLLDGVLAGPFLPREAIVRSYDGYRRFRHRLGELLVRSSPRLYRMFGGTDPA